MNYSDLLISKGFSFFETEKYDDNYYGFETENKKEIWKICKIFGIGYANPTDNPIMTLYVREHFDNCFIAYGIKYIEMHIEDFIEYVKQI